MEGVEFKTRRIGMENKKREGQEKLLPKITNLFSQELQLGIVSKCWHDTLGPIGFTNYGSPDPTLVEPKVHTSTSTLLFVGPLSRYLHPFK